MAEDAAKVAATYFDAWKVNDFDTMRSLLDDDVTYIHGSPGPTGRRRGLHEGDRGLVANHV